MGQAKRRGSFEERKAEAVQRQCEESAKRDERFKIEEAERKKKWEEYLDSLPPHERQAREGRRKIVTMGSHSMPMAMAVALASAMAAGTLGGVVVRR